ncbi:response regulator transcription factor [Candidatus Woesebacteria bacterium]|jgi:DNA-binding response OmpR family regulator|nr:response regulator transcription factor [Candidatus Woesebacteria bacterium]MBP9687143.1 response regulator transcription factor [Candidatus Woesebacteria bacterium]
MNPTAKHKILIVEDDPLLTKMYTTKFITEGFDVDSAADGEEGLAKATTVHPNFIVLDVMMPKLSGIDMLSRLRATEAGKDIPVIVLSNLSQEEEAKKALSLGAKEYLIKANFTPSEVVTKVRMYLTP